MKIKKNIVFRFVSKILDGKTFIFDIYSGKLLVSSKCAFDILNLLKENIDIDEISNILSIEKECVLEFVDTLSKNNFIEGDIYVKN